MDRKGSRGNPPHQERQKKESFTGIAILQSRKLALLVRRPKKLENFTHDPPLSEKVQQIIKPIYEDLSEDELLERCLGGNTQNNNGSYNGLLWHFAPKHLYSGVKTIQIANYLAVGIFNEDFYTVLKVFETMGIVAGPIAKNYADKRDNEQIMQVEKRHEEASKEARREAQAALQELYKEEEGVLYGIAD